MISYLSYPMGIRRTMQQQHSQTINAFKYSNCLMANIFCNKKTYQIRRRLQAKRLEKMMQSCTMPTSVARFAAPLSACTFHKLGLRHANADLAFSVQGKMDF